ncbi:Six-hairpin glycosidase-like protein [Chytridium lagenaria]|nr:Six-hairpin glycosidase-like protein [Chytridium lagenaria]
MRGSFLIAAFVAFVSFVSADSVDIRRRAALVTVTSPNVPTSGNVVLQQYSYDAETGVFSGSIWIRNIAFNKVVNLFYSTPALAWNTANKVDAAYSGPATNGFEVWSFSSSPAALAAGSQFYLKYTGNHRSSYFYCAAASPPVTVTSTTAVTTSKPSPTSTQPPQPAVTVISAAPPAADGAPVLVKEYSFIGGALSGGVWVKNLAFSKAVTIIASSASGVFEGASTTATYSSSAANGYELWTFLGSFPNAGTGSKFYVKYDVNGVSYYDSNGGPDKNYPITATIAPPIAGGLAADITSWFAAALPSIKQYLYKNISPAETIRGVVVAAPKIQAGQQSYFFHWIRDASLVMDVINNLYKDGDVALESKLWDFQSVTKINQGKLNSAGGFGEPKYFVNGEPFNGPWCRPQNDGPALRASLFIRFAKAFLAKGGSLTRVVELYNSTASGVIKPDLDYGVTKLGMSERRAFKEGAEFATFLGDTASAARYAAAAATRDAEVAKYWNPSVNTLMTTLNARQLDAAIALTANHAYNNDGVYGPADDRVLNSLFQFSRGFATEYALNSRPLIDGSGLPLSYAIGRYYGDTYNGLGNSQGNPWYLTTNAVGETYYRAAIDFIKSGKVAVTPLNRAFFTSSRPAGVQAGNIALGTYTKDTPEFKAIVDGLASLADSHIRRTKLHGDINFRFGEQYLRSDGTANGLGVQDLTWSYASFITANEAREELKALLV